MSTSIFMPQHNSQLNQNGLVFEREPRVGESRDTQSFFRYFPSNSETSNNSVNVTGIGRVVTPPESPYPRNCHPSLYNFDWNRGRILPEFQVLLITDGAGEFESRTTGRMIFESPVVITLLPGVWHRYRPLSRSGWTERWLSFDGELAHRLFSTSQASQRSQVTSVNSAERFILAFDSLINSISNRSIVDPNLITIRALRIIVEVANKRMEEAVLENMEPGNTDVTSGVDDPVVDQALIYIWSQSQGPISVNDVARQLPVTRRTLDRRFAETVGHSVLEEIIKCRMSRAKRLLVATDLSVKKVAFLAGFPSPERMRVAFVENEGMPPHTYRQRLACGN